MTGRRLGSGGRIDRARTLTMRFDGRRIAAHPGDTLASALLANGECIVARGFKYHRPRGVFASGVEEPSALVHLRTGARREPNARATTVEAFDGLEATAQNAWPSVRWDIGAINGLLAPVFAAGFYYKTFMGPLSGTGFWMFCERFIRQAAGMGRAPVERDPDIYEKVNAFCDLLVVGSGPSGLAAALTAGRAGADVILVEQDFRLGGSLLSQPAGAASDRWLAEVEDQLAALPNVKCLRRTTAFGAFDAGVFGLVEHVNDHLPQPDQYQPRQRFWRVRAARAVLAAGALERPIVFGNNDLPGVMLAGAMQTYANRYAVLPGERIVLATNNDSAYAAAADLARAGAHVTLCDARSAPDPTLVEVMTAAGVTCRTGQSVLRARGRRRVTGAVIVPVDAQGRATGAGTAVRCDAIGTSAGWTPTVHLWSQLFGKPRFDEQALSFVPETDRAGRVHCAGRMTAAQTLPERIRSGEMAARSALGIKTADVPTPEAPPLDTGWLQGMSRVWRVATARGKSAGMAFVDLQHDVKLSDIDLAYREGYASVEHLKRYTTTGMAADQGKTSNMPALARLSEIAGRDLPEMGTTTFRPPFTPVTVGALVGHEQGPHFRPTRRSPLHAVHERLGAEMTEAGLWMRPRRYGEPGESLREAYIREATAVRSCVGLVDVSTLGKIAVQGPDAPEFLDRLYVNDMSTLAIGRIRYGVMLRTDGFAMDDGTAARLGEHDYFVTTTTANAAKVLAFAEQLLQTDWADLRVHVTSVTDQWAAIALAGPRARDVLVGVAEDAETDLARLRNARLTSARIGGVPVRIHRMSYSGELAYEIYIGAGFGADLWEALMEAGAPYGIIPYGTEAMGALRIEKGHIAGPEIDGRTTLRDLGLAGMASKKKPFIGSVLQDRPALTDPDRPILVGLESSAAEPLPPGALVFAKGAAAAGHGEGWVSSSAFSPELSRQIALAFVARGRDRMGEEIDVVDLLSERRVRARIVSPHFVDPRGERQNA